MFDILGLLQLLKIELRYFCHNLFFILSSPARYFNGNLTFKIRLLARRKVVLTKLLQETPFWARGHLELCKTDVELLWYVKEKRDPRLVAEQSLSAKAFACLSKSDTAPETNILAEYYQALSMYFRQNYENALELLSKILDTNQSILLSEREYFLALEVAGICAVALERRDVANSYFESIPKSGRSQEVNFAMENMVTEKFLPKARPS
jgi:tetratricopeptide (TPR) repeat protein